MQTTDQSIDNRQAPPAFKPGKLSDGFNLIARDFDRAVKLAGLNGTQRSLIDEARELSWTLATLQRLDEALPFRLPLSELARQWHCDLRGLRRQLRGLIAARVFVEAADGYHINKDYRDWVSPETGEPLLAPDQVELAADAKRLRRVRGFVVTGNGCVIATRIPASTPGSNLAHPPGDNRPEGTDIQGIFDPTLGTKIPSSLGTNLPTPGTKIPSDPGQISLGVGTNIPSSHYIGARAELNSEIPERELRETEDIYTAREPIRSQPTRTPTDFAEVREAARILASNLETQHLSSRLLQEHNLPGLIAIPGSHFVHAANVALSGKLTHGQRKAWPYFTKIASNYQPGQDAPTQADKPQVPYYREFIARMKARAQAEAEAEAKECSCESTTGSGIGSTGTSPGTSGSGPETPVPSRPPASSTPGGLLS